MARKIKICPKCKTWTAGKGEYCGDCGETLIETGYTDMFFMIGVTAGLLVNGLGHIIILLNKIIRNMTKE